MLPENACDTDMLQILRARAADLAMPLPADVPIELVDLLVFRVGEERFAIAVGEANEAIRISEITWLPRVPPFYRGLISHRGIVFPLVDIRPLVGRPAAGGAHRHAILFTSDELTMAIAVDALESFVRLPVSEIAATSPGDEGAGLSAIWGLAPGALVVLDARVLLGDARLVIDERPNINDHAIKENA
jgi:purine-binding chemotaxis protein CheW